MATARVTCTVCRRRKPTAKMKAVRNSRGGTLWICSSCVDSAKEAFGRGRTIKKGSFKARIALVNLYQQMQGSKPLAKGPKPSKRKSTPLASSRKHKKQKQ
jgi:protein-arginine kinase activator protein McsA